MSDELHPILRRCVDRAVGSLHVTAGRRSLMREELAVHLSGIYAQESERVGEGQAALDATLRRFGDVDELAKELEASAPALERILFTLFNEERRMWRMLVLGGVLAFMFGMAMVLPALAKFKHLGIEGSPVIGLTIGVTIVVAGIHLLGWGIARKIRKAGGPVGPSISHT